MHYVIAVKYNFLFFFVTFWNSPYQKDKQTQKIMKKLILSLVVFSSICMNTIAQPLFLSMLKLPAKALKILF